MPPLDRHHPSLALLAGLALSVHAQDVATDSVTTAPIVPKTPDTSATVLREVKVQEKALRAPTPPVPAKSARLGSLGTVPTADAPYTLQVVTADDISDRDAHNLLQAARGSTPIYAVMLPANDGRGDAEPQLRGSDPSFLMDDLPFGSGIRPEVEALDRVEILDGPSAAFYGFSGTGLGGTIDFRLKQPVDTSRVRFSLGQYAGSLNHVEADLGGRLDSAGFLDYRFDAYREKGEGYVRGSNQERLFVLAALDFKPTSGLLFKASASHHEFDFQGQQICFQLDATKFSVPDPDLVDPYKLYGQSWSFTRGTQDQVLGGFQADLGPVRAEGSTWFGHTWRQSRTVSGLIVDNAGNYSQTYKDGGPSEAWNWSGTARVGGAFSTGIVRHDAGVGYVGLFNLQRANPSSVSRIFDTCNIANPVADAMPETFVAYSEAKRTRAVNHAFSVQDKLDVGPWASAVAGLGWGLVESRTDNTTTGVSSSVYHENGLAPTVGVIAKPYAWLRPYANWTRGLVVGGTTTTSWARNANEYLAPSHNDQIEAGVKSTVKAGRIAEFDLGACYYHLDKVNEYIDPSDSVYKQDGREIHQGVELSAEGKVLSQLKVQGRFSWIDAWVDKAKNNTALEDKTPANVPDQLGRFGLEYAFTGSRGLSANGAVNWAGRRAVDALNTQYLPSVATFDAGLRYNSEISGHGVALQVGVTNVFNKTYWATYKPTGTVGLVLGEPRVVSVSGQVQL